MQRRTMAFLGAIVLIATGAATPPPELESFLSYPFVSDIVGNGRTDSFAWLEMRNGVRAVWVAEGPARSLGCCIRAEATTAWSWPA